MSAQPGLVARVRQRLVEIGSPLTYACVLAAARDIAGAATNDSVLAHLTRALRTDLVASASINALLDDPEVTDVLINGATDVWVDRGVGLQRIVVPHHNEAEVVAMAQRLAVACGQRLDEAKPWVDARLPDGTRLHALIAPVATNGVCICLRTFRPRVFTLSELIDLGCVPSPAGALLRALLAARLAFLVTGGTSTGKTTFLASLLGELPPRERIVVVEDSHELRCSHPHVVSLQARNDNADGVGAVPLRDVVRQALRMRPDRIVVGECRGAEVVELLYALNTGHDGCAGTLHANSPTDVPARLEALGALGGLGRAALHSQLAASLPCVFHMRRINGRRILDEVAILRRDPSGLVGAVTAWAVDDRPAPAGTELDELIVARGGSR